MFFSLNKKEYTLSQFEIREKKEIYKTIKSNVKKNRLISRLLYKEIPSVEQYIEKLSKKKDLIKIIMGYKGNRINDNHTLYRHDKFIIKYNIFKNNYNVIVAWFEVIESGRKRTKFSRKFFQINQKKYGIQQAEYEAKVFILKETRKLLNSRNIY